MNAQIYSAIKPMAQPRGMICGVCVRMATNTGLPVWVPRAAFVVLGLMHLVLAAILYVAAAAICHRCNGQAVAPPAPRPFYPAGGEAETMRARFARLDARLAAMEAESLRNEAGLNREFRNLDRTS
jgi:phage shock protein PspC (stress-responsive transcriptional regulator)